MKGRTLLAGIGLSLGLLAIAAETNPSGLITAGAPAPVVISSVMVPPVQERSVMFSDRGRTYLVGVVTGKVIVVDGSNPAPSPVVPPYNPPAPSLTGLAKQAYDSVMGLPLDSQNRTLGANALIQSIDATISEAGGLGITDPQTLVNNLAASAEANRVNQFLQGFKLGDLLAGASITSKEQLVSALLEVRKGLEKVK